MKITGERVVSAAGGFNPTWQRHAAAYALCAGFLGPGKVLDLGCGVGHSYDRLVPRPTVGLDVDPRALDGQARETVVADIRELPLEDESFPSTVAVQSIEHVPDPERAVSEAARVLESGGVAVFVTPNRLTLGRPEEIIDPYHHVELDARELQALCERSFAQVEVHGLFGSARYMELFDAERRKLDALLGLDPARLRRLVPRRARQRLYDSLLRHYRPAYDPRAEAITVEDFQLRADGLAESLDLVAVCRSPLRPPAPSDRRAMAVAEARAPSCAWCGAPLDRRRPGSARRTLCRNCGAYTTDPWPSEAELGEAYSSWYRPGSGRRFSFFGDRLLSRSRAHLAGRLDRIAPPGPVLDVGAGDGALIDALRRRGRRAEGLEREPRRPDLSDRPLAEIEGSWAAVVFWHSLEHLPEPGQAVGEAIRLLAPGGVLAIAVPNAASLQARAFGERWLHLDPPRHLVHLPAAALIRRLRASGLKIERVSHFRAGQIVIGWLDGLVGTLPGGLDLYQALRRPEARSEALPRSRRWGATATGAVLLGPAVGCAALEILIRRSGTVYVEARRA